METILPYPDHLELVYLTATTHSITAVVRPLQSSNECPLCHQPPAPRCHPAGTLRPLAPHVAYLLQRWNEGCRNATQL
jgi:hypothetical protein